MQPHDEGKGREGKGLPGACSSPVMARRRSSDGGAGRAERRARGRRASGGEETSSTRPELLTVSIADFCSTVRLSISSLLLIKRRRGGPTTVSKKKSETRPARVGNLGCGSSTARKKKSEIKENRGVARCERERVLYAVGDCGRASYAILVFVPLTCGL